MGKIKEQTGSLLFHRGTFELREVSDSKLRLKLHLDENWENIGNDSYTTKSLGAAARYREWGDEKVKRLFKTTFQEHYSFPHTAELPPELDDHQVSGLDWILTRKRSYLAHAPGAGKTAQAILGGHFSQGRERVLFIVPPSLVKNWEEEIYKVMAWVNEFPTIGIVGGSDKRENVAWKSTFIIVPDSMLAKTWVAKKLREIEWKFIAVDEASRFKESTSERSLAFYGGWYGKEVQTKFTNLFRSARHVVFLDGSPMPNRPMELWAPTFSLHPQAIDCMGRHSFGFRFCGARQNGRGEWEYLYSSHEEELKRKLQADFMHVVTEHGLDHPERRRSMVVLSHDVRSVEHKRWEETHLKDLELGSGPWSEDLSQGEMAHFRRELGLRKVSYIAQRTRECLEKGESILLFVWHRDVAAQLMIEFPKIPCGLINGGVDKKKRSLLIKEFQSGKKKLLIMNIAASGRGYNLQRADRVIFGEFSWTDETNKQAEKRASRKGSTKSFVRCEYLVCPNSIDQVVLKSVFTKEKRVRKVIG